MGDAEIVSPRYELVNVPPKIGGDGPAYDTKLVIKAMSSAHGQAPVQRFQIDLPDHCGLGDIVISPRGDKIAWLMGEKPPLPEFFLTLGARNDASVRVCVSDIDGSHMRDLGYERCPARYYHDSDVFDGVSLSDLQWVPGGKHLSFVLANTLYVIPIE